MRRFSPSCAALILIASAPTIAVAHPELRPFVLKAPVRRYGEESILCYRGHTPQRPIDVGRVKIVMPGAGGHDVTLLRPRSEPEEYPPKNCALDVDYDLWEPIAKTLSPLLDWQLPPGVAFRLPPHQPLLVQTHYLGGPRSTDTSTPIAKTILYRVNPASVTAHAGTFLLDDRALAVPPGRTTATSRCILTGDGTAARDLHILGLAGHYHFRGFRFEAYRVHTDGSLGEQLYGYQGFDTPVFRQFDGSLVLHAGEGIEWRCTYQNDTARTFTLGSNWALGEHCILSGSYYPTNTPQEAIHCVHDRDAAGNDTTQRMAIE